jgi:hypothetical protein
METDAAHMLEGHHVHGADNSKSCDTVSHCLKRDAYGNSRNDPGLDTYHTRYLYSKLLGGIVKSNPQLVVALEQAPYVRLHREPQLVIRRQDSVI